MTNDDLNIYHKFTAEDRKRLAGLFDAIVKENLKIPVPEKGSTSHLIYINQQKHGIDVLACVRGLGWLDRQKEYCGGCDCLVCKRWFSMWHGLLSLLLEVFTFYPDDAKESVVEGVRHLIEEMWEESRSNRHDDWCEDGWIPPDLIDNDDESEEWE